MNRLTPAAGNIVDILWSWAETQPDARLFGFLNSSGEIIEEFSYSEFAKRVNTLANAILESGCFKFGDRLVLSYQPGIEIIAALFACARLGLIAVPIPPLSAFDFTAWVSRLEYILDDCSAAGMLTCRRTIELFEEGSLQATQAKPVAAAKRIKSLPTIETTDVLADDKILAPGVHAKQPIVFIQYTSGSTSNPKGVCVSHENLIANCQAVVDHDKPVSVCWLPQHHDMGLIGYYIYTALSGGVTWGLSPRSFIQRPSLWLELITRYRATATSVPNFALELCLNERRIPCADLERFDLSSLRFLMAAAEPIVPETFNAFRRKFARSGLRQEAFYVAYGLAEFTLAVSSYGRDVLTIDRRQLAQGFVVPVENAAGVSHALPLMSCGRALGDSDIRIVDPYSGIEEAAGKTGEIWVSGAARTLGYWNKQDVNQVVFQARLMDAKENLGPYLRTGDIGFVHAGELFVCGRLKDMIIIRGQNIYPEDIEAIVRQVCPELRSNGVVAFSSDSGSQTSITLVAETARGQKLPSETAIVRAIREGLQIPIARVVFVPPRSVSRTSSGKLRRAHTRELLESGQLQVLMDTRHHLSSVELSKKVDVYELELLKDRYHLSGEEDFTLFDAGIDSLDLVVFLNWIKDSLCDAGASELAQRINPRLLSMISINELFAIARQFNVAPTESVKMLTEFLGIAHELRMAKELQDMQSDRAYTVDPRRIMAVGNDAPIGTLVTGGTGFLGPFLLDALLRKSKMHLHVLVRAGSQEMARQRLDAAFLENISDPASRLAYQTRVHVVLGNLEVPRLGLAEAEWSRLARGIDTVYHNGALVNYLLPYSHMRAANVEGTSSVLDLCLESHHKILNYISTTFIFGWSTKDYLFETDSNATMDKLDFGYSQSKWVAEQRVLAAINQGLLGRVFRPALITPGLNGTGGSLDITIRLFSFMIKHGIGVDASNQVSFTPANITADNIVAIATQPETLGGTFHVVRDKHETMSMITEIIGRKLGISFETFKLSEFVPQVIKRCTRADPLYPLLDFLVGSVGNISAMEFKLYENSNYRTARDRVSFGQADPGLEQIVDGLLTFMKRRNLL